MEKRYNTNWYMTLMFMLSMVVSLSFSACSDDDKNSSEQDMINTYVTKFQEQISEMAALRDDSPYGLQQGMYPEESKDILNSAIKKLEQVIENLSNGSYVEPAKSKFEQLLAETKRAIANFKESIRTTDYVDPNEDYELYVNGHQGGYIDFGVSPNFSRFVGRISIDSIYDGDISSVIQCRTPRLRCLKHRLLFGMLCNTTYTTEREYTKQNKTTFQYHNFLFKVGLPSVLLPGQTAVIHLF